MSLNKKEAVENIKHKLENEVLLRCQLDSPYIEEYVNIAVTAIVDEIFDAIKDHHDELIRNARMASRIGRTID